MYVRAQQVSNQLAPPTSTHHRDSHHLSYLPLCWLLLSPPASPDWSCREPRRTKTMRGTLWSSGRAGSPVLGPGSGQLHTGRDQALWHLMQHTDTHTHTTNVLHILYIIPHAANNTVHTYNAVQYIRVHNIQSHNAVQYST